MRSTSLFSKPSSFWFDSGRLSGSAHTRSSRGADLTPADIMSARPTVGTIRRNALSTARITCLLVNLEDVQEMPRPGELGQLPHHAGDRRRIVERELVRDESGRPSADAGPDRDTLLAVGSEEGNRVSDDPR